MAAAEYYDPDFHLPPAYGRYIENRQGSDEDEAAAESSSNTSAAAKFQSHLSGGFLHGNSPPPLINKHSSAAGMAVKAGLKMVKVGHKGGEGTKGAGSGRLTGGLSGLSLGGLTGLAVGNREKDNYHVQTEEVGSDDSEGPEREASSEMGDDEDGESDEDEADEDDNEEEQEDDEGTDEEADEGEESSGESSNESD